jgi:aminobenzoyl-glutamate utilization protein A
MVDVTGSESQIVPAIRLIADAPRLRQLAVSARDLQPDLVADRRFLHAHPELGWEEAETTAFVANRLTQLGYTVRIGSDFLGTAPRLGQTANAVMETGLVAELEGAGPGPIVAVRVDLDALPILEADHAHRPAEQDWSSRRPGVMHACAHDGHIAIGLAVARLIAERAGAFGGRFRLLFQPAEEGTRGARSVVAAGWLRDVDVLLGYHIGMGVPTGTVALGTRGFLATRKYGVRLSGRPAHAGNAPEQGRNALAGACHIVLGLQALAQSSRPGVRVNVGTLQSGVALNVIPETATLGFELRAGAQQDLEALAERATALIEGIALAHGLRHEIELVGEAADWANPSELAEWARSVCRSVGLFETHLMDHDFGASEDATLMLRDVAARGGRAGYFVLGSDLAAPHHTPGFDFDEAVLWSGVAFVGVLALSALGSDDGDAEAPATEARRAPQGRLDRSGGLHLTSPAPT